MNDSKQAFEKAFVNLTDDRKVAILKYWDTSSVNTLIRQAKQEAQDMIDLADRKGYGYGEVGFYLKESVEDFAVEVPELKKEYNNLIHEYFDMLVEVKEA